MWHSNGVHLPLDFLAQERALFKNFVHEQICLRALNFRIRKSKILLPAWVRLFINRDSVKHSSHRADKFVVEFIPSAIMLTVIGYHVHLKTQNGNSELPTATVTIGNADRQPFSA